METYALPMSVKFGNNKELFIERSNKPLDISYDSFSETIYNMGKENDEIFKEDDVLDCSKWDVKTIQEKYSKQNDEFRDIFEQFVVNDTFIDNNNVYISRDKTMSNPVKCSYKYEKIDFTTDRITFKFISKLPKNFILGLFHSQLYNYNFHNLKSTSFYLFNLTKICNDFTTTFDKNEKHDKFKVLITYKDLLDDECLKKITNYITELSHGMLSDDLSSLITSFFFKSKRRNGPEPRKRSNRKRSKTKRSKSRRIGAEPRKRSNRKRSKAV